MDGHCIPISQPYQCYVVVAKIMHASAFLLKGLANWLFLKSHFPCKGWRMLLLCAICEPH